MMEPLTAFGLVFVLPVFILYLAAWTVHVCRDDVPPLRALLTVFTCWIDLWRRLR